MCSNHISVQLNRGGPRHFNKKKEIRVIIAEEKKLNCPYLKTSNCLQRKPRRRANLVELRRLQQGYKRNISGVPISNQLQNVSQTSNEN